MSTWMFCIFVNMLLCLAAAAQQETVKVIACSLVKTPYDITFSSPGQSYTSCTGDANAFGNFSSFSAHCNTTTNPPRETAVTRHIYTYYTVVESETTAYLVSCSRKFRWDRCPTLVPGETYTLLTKSHKVELAGKDTNKPLKLELIQAVMLNKPQTSREQSNPISAQLEITSSPAGAEISVDGNFVGDTPSELAVAAGVHTITISKRGYKPWERKLTVSSGKVTVAAELEQ